MRCKNLTLPEIAHLAMNEQGFIPDFPIEVLQEIESISHPHPPYTNSLDLREKLWVSIDNDDSRDLDQLTYAEGDRLFVAVADVDGLVKKGSAIDSIAAHNTTSIYTPGLVFSMLPLPLSTNLTSLNEHCDRTAIVTELQVEQDGRFQLVKISLATVRNQAKLTYNAVGNWLENGGEEPLLPPLPGLKEQLLLQSDLTKKIQGHRDRKGALEFADTELEPILVDGKVVSLRAKKQNLAHFLIENAMIAANVAVTDYLLSQGRPTILRVVRKPKRWARIVKLAKNLGEELPAKPNAPALRAFLLKQQKTSPLLFPDLSLAIIKLLGRGEYVLGEPDKPFPGHFNLAEMEYAHSTAPNRRYPDLIVQRLLKSCLLNCESPYTLKELIALATHCTAKEGDAQKVERRMIKCAAAVLLEKEIGRKYPAMVTGVTPKGTWVRLETLPIEGKLVRNLKGVDVGDFIEVQLTRVDTLNGHIDFARVKKPLKSR
jgi:exoribonuclease II